MQSMLAKFRKKPVTVSAIPYDGTFDGYRAVLATFPATDFGQWCGDGCFSVPTLEGDHTASPGDWIILGVKGELYPCKPDIFEMTYDRVEPLPEHVTWIVNYPRGSKMRTGKCTCGWDGPLRDDLDKVISDISTHELLACSA